MNCDYVTPAAAEKAFLSERTPNSAAEAARARMLERMGIGQKVDRSPDQARAEMIERQADNPLREQE